MAPVPRLEIMIGRTLGGATVAVIQGLLVMAICLIAGFRPQNFWTVPLAMGFMVAIAMVFAALGVAIGSSLQDMQGFQLIMNFLVLPIFFLLRRPVSSEWTTECAGGDYPARSIVVWDRWYAIDPAGQVCLQSTHGSARALLRRHCSSDRRCTAVLENRDMTLNAAAVLNLCQPSATRKISSGGQLRQA